MYNLTTIIGNVGEDAKTRTFDNGSAVTNFNVATTETWKSKDGEKKESTTWFRVNYWSCPEKLLPYIKKGAKVLVTGKVYSSAYVNKDGDAIPVLEIKVESFRMVEFVKDEDKKPVETNNAEINNEAFGNDNDLPF